MIIGGLKSSSSRRSYRKDNREVQLIHTKPSQPLHWSKQPITFSRADHWVHIPDPGSYPLIVDPIIEGALLPQTLIDGGSGLNVIFVNTLKKMDFDFKRLTECDEPFFGIVPDMAAYPMGRVSLPITFDTEYLNFEVADFKSSYHTILGRPMLSRFMVVPHYTYLVLKIPPPKESSQFTTTCSSRSSATMKPRRSPRRTPASARQPSWWPEPRRSPRPT
jgi:hypothetical protein